MVRIKTIITALSLFIIILIPLLRNSFYLPAEIKRWSQLEWDDFKGIVRPFTQYGAAIHSKVYAEYDSIKGKYVAYAGQNNRRSWVKNSTKNYESSLRHEQYHFNITEYHARLLNEELQSNDSVTKSQLSSMLNEINWDLSEMQDQYDDQTDHSLITHQQNYWEFKVDSLLQVHSPENGLVTDSISGLQVWYPSEPDFVAGINDHGVPYRYYELKKYGMGFSSITFQFEQNLENYETNIIHFYQNDSIRIDSIHIDRVDDHIKAYVMVSDTSQNKEFQHLWYGTPSKDYKISAHYPLSENNDLYQKIAFDFLQSFKIADTDSIWINMVKDYSGIVTSKTTSSQDLSPEQVSEGLSFCYSKHSDLSLIHRDPFSDQRGNLYLVYDILKHQDSLVLENFVMINNEDLLHYPVDTVNQVIIVPNDLLKDKSEIYFGYFVKADSLKECYTFYKEIFIYENGEFN